MSGGTDHTSVPTPAGTRGPGNGPVSMGISSIDERDLGRGVDNGERSTGTDETRSGARDYDGGRGRDDEGDPQECEHRSGQRRVEVRR